LAVNPIHFSRRCKTPTGTKKGCGTIGEANRLCEEHSDSEATKQSRSQIFYFWIASLNAREDNEVLLRKNPSLKIENLGID